MLIEIRVPRLGNDAKEAILVAWHKQRGDAVVADESLADVMTDQVNVEITSPATGVLREARATPDQMVAI